MDWLWGTKRKDRNIGRKKRSQGRRERLDLFEQSGCNESSQRSLGVDRWSEQRKEEGGKSECGEIQLQTDCWT